MNRNQKLAVIASLILIALMIMVPPYHGQFLGFRHSYPRTSGFVGYWPIFAPPSQKQLVRPLVGDDAAEVTKSNFIYANLCSASIHFLMLGIQIVIVVVVTAGAVLFLKTRV